MTQVPVLESDPPAATRAALRTDIAELLDEVDVRWAWQGPLAAGEKWDADTGPSDLDIWWDPDLAQRTEVLHRLAELAPFAPVAEARDPRRLRHLSLAFEISGSLAVVDFTQGDRRVGEVLLSPARQVQLTGIDSGPWVGFGPERTVTRSMGNVLYELDGRPALELYKSDLGELAAKLPGSGLRFPLALRESEATERQLVRTVLAVDETSQSMTFAGDIPQGWCAQLMRASSDQLLDGAEEAAVAAAPEASAGPVLAVAISCVGRRMVLGEGADEEVEATLGSLPEGSAQVGCYSYGELSPVATGPCELHNQTMTLTTFREN